jgi:hypothetical protein
MGSSKTMTASPTCASFFFDVEPVDEPGASELEACALCAQPLSYLSLRSPPAESPTHAMPPVLDWPWRHRVCTHGSTLSGCRLA